MSRRLIHRSSALFALSIVGCNAIFGLEESSLRSDAEGGTDAGGLGGSPNAGAATTAAQSHDGGAAGTDDAGAAGGETGGGASAGRSNVGGNAGALGKGGSSGGSGKNGGGGSLPNGGASATAGSAGSSSGSGGTLSSGGSAGASKGGSSGTTSGGTSGSAGSGGAASACNPSCTGGQVCGASATCACPLANPNFCSNTCTNQQTDKENCGACGHSCFGGACNAGVCQPVTLASGRVAPWAIAVNASGVYWLEQAAVMAVPLNGGNVVQLGSSSTTSTPRAIAVSANTLYWSNGLGAALYAGALVQVSTLGGGSASQFAKATVDISNPWGIAISAGVVYWVDTEWGKIFKASEGAATVSPASVGSNNGTYFGNIAVDGTNLYSANSQRSLVKTVIASGAVTPLTPLDPTALIINQIATQQGFVYWSSGQATPPQTTTPANSVISKVSTSGGTVSVLASGLAVTPALAADASGIYWDNGDLRRTPVAGGTSVVLAAMQNAGFIALDSQCVYWTDASSGTVKKLAK